MEDYGENTDSSTNRKSYIRVKSRNGEAMDLSEATLDTRVTASLKFAVSAFCMLVHNLREKNGLHVSLSTYTLLLMMGGTKE